MDSRPNVLTRKRQVAAGLAIAWVNLAVLGALIGWVGASRAYSVGLHTLFRDHLPTVAVSWIVTIGLACLVGRRFTSAGDIWIVLLWVFVGDAVAGLAPIVVYDEIRRHPDIIRILATETAGFTQLGAALIGLVGGFAVHRGGAGEPQISAGR
jgi:hypothetical protein